MNIIITPLERGPNKRGVAPKPHAVEMTMNFRGGGGAVGYSAFLSHKEARSVAQRLIEAAEACE